MRRSFFSTALLALVLSAPASAATLTVTVVDGRGRVMRDAVVTLIPNEQGRMPDAASALSGTKIVDQRNEAFLPLVTVLPVGGSIVFSNSDDTMHHVYSFAPVKQFEFVLNSGEKSGEVRFDRAGIAAIGCNIHDRMISYVYVTDSPWTVLTGPDGIARFEVPPGAYRTSLWHPEMAPGRQVPATSLVIGTAPATATMTMPRLPVRARSSSHRGDY
jgi:plastocyanin